MEQTENNTENTGINKTSSALPSQYTLISYATSPEIYNLKCLANQCNLITELNNNKGR